jgi:hypothetical protein
MTAITRGNSCVKNAVTLVMYLKTVGVNEREAKSKRLMTRKKRVR